MSTEMVRTNEIGGAKTYTFVKELPGWAGDARLYRLSEPLEGHEYVVVSATDVVFSGPETYIFASDADGEVTNWGELDGSFRGAKDHEAALAGAGYAVEYVAPVRP